MVQYAKTDLSGIIHRPNFNTERRFGAWCMSLSSGKTYSAGATDTCSCLHGLSDFVRGDIKNICNFPSRWSPINRPTVSLSLCMTGHRWLRSKIVCIHSKNKIMHGKRSVPCFYHQVPRFHFLVFKMADKLKRKVKIFWTVDLMEHNSSLKFNSCSASL